jgi:DNA-binding response OmpR family regulator
MPSATTAAIRRARGDAPSLLWIDDEVQPSSAEVHLLELEGFLVDCSPTGAAGLAMARNKNYEAILLDLHLPDIPGLAVSRDSSHRVDRYPGSRSNRVR